MAKAKKAKKTGSTKKKAVKKKVAAVAAPKTATKKKATRTAASGSTSPKKAKKVSKKNGAVKRRRVWISVMTSKDAIPKPALKLIKEIDEVEVQIADLQDTQRELLQKLVKSLPDPNKEGKMGGRTFEHPDRGPMTIMHREHEGEEKWFWRAKPQGMPQRLN